MKNFILTLLVLITLFPFAKAQKASFGVTAGTTFSQVRLSDNESKDNTNYLFGFSAGVTADLPLGKNFSFQPALQFLQKGGREKSDFFGNDATITIRLNYLDLPLNFLYRAPGTNGHFVVGLGPSVSVGLSGKDKISSSDGTEEEDIHFGSGSDHLKAFELGGNILMGYEWKSGFSVQANYNHGLSNNSNDSDTKWKSAYFDAIGIVLI